MGYDAHDLDTDFRVPAAKVADALAAYHRNLTDDDDDEDDGYQWYQTLAEAAAAAGFDDSDNPGENRQYAGFSLGWHTDDHWDEDASVPFLTALGPFAEEGSYVRMIGEDDAIWGYRVVGGKLHEESGVYEWTTEAERKATADALAQARAAVAVLDQEPEDDDGYDDREQDARNAAAVDLRDAFQVLHPA